MAQIGKYLLISIPCTSFGLSYWQIKRLEWKKKLIKDLEDRRSREPIDLREIDSLNELKNSEYCRVRLTGFFDKNLDNQIYLTPRPLVVNREAILRGKSAHQSNIGLNVVTPFTLEGTDLRVLINRGWLAIRGPDSLDNPDNRKIPGAYSPNPIELIGIIRSTDARPRYTQKNDESKNEWQFRDIEAMSKVLKTAPIYLDAESSLSKNTGPIGGQTQLNVRNEHLNYAITWFSLGCLCLVMWYGKYGKHKFRSITAISR